MSSSYRNLALRHLGWALCALVLSTFAATRGARAQEVTFIPQGSVTAEYATNRTLATPPVADSEDFQVQAGGDLKANSQIASFDLRPLLTYLDDTKIKNLNQYEALVDLVSAYRTQKTEWDLDAEFQRQDAFDAEYGVAVFNPLNPNAPNTQGTGFIVTGDTRTSFDVEPKFSYDMTQRWSLSGDAAFDAAHYSTDIPGYLVSFNSESAELDTGYALSRESTLAAGPYYNNYQPTNDNVGAVREHGYGLNVNYNYKVSQITSTKVTVRVERDTTPAAYGFPEESLTAWSAEWTGTHRFLTSQVQFSIGRFLQPSSFGGRTSVDQFRVQYSRTFSYRLSGTVAVRVTRNTDIGDVTTEDSGNRDRAQLQAALGYLITEELTLTGGYRYAYQSLPAFDTTATGALVSAGNAHAHSNAIFLTVTYHGRDATRQ